MGPFQFPEKLIPLMIRIRCRGRPLPVYGDGLQVRDWLYVGDHASALRAVLERGRVGETYNVGGGEPTDKSRSGEDVVWLAGRVGSALEACSHERLVKYVTDRPGHDRRYAIDARKLERELGWRAQESFETGLRKTVEWYLANSAWVEHVTSGAYQHWITENYAGRTEARGVTAAGKGAR